jgi:hypothetical protein
MDLNRRHGPDFNDTERLRSINNVCACPAFAMSLWIGRVCRKRCKDTKLVACRGSVLSVRCWRAPRKSKSRMLQPVVEHGQAMVKAVTRVCKPLSKRRRHRPVYSESVQHIQCKVGSIIVRPFWQQTSHSNPTRTYLLPKGVRLATTYFRTHTFRYQHVGKNKAQS